MHKTECVYSLYTNTLEVNTVVNKTLCSASGTYWASGVKDVSPSRVIARESAHDSSSPGTNGASNFSTANYDGCTNVEGTVDYLNGTIKI